jgi:hypothetical protein
MRKFISVIAVAFCMLTVKTFAIQPEETKQEEKPIIVSAEHKAAILKLFEVSGYMDELNGMMNNMLNRVFMMMPDINDKDWDKIKSEVTLDSLLDQQIATYGESFNIDEINELVKIFSTPVYKKMRKQGETLSETLSANENYFFNELKYILGEKLDKKGYDVPDYLKKEQPKEKIDE